jgi:hypothetical protein
MLHDAPPMHLSRIVIVCVPGASSGEERAVWTCSNELLPPMPLALF